jgi:hypothetical protein
VGDEYLMMEAASISETSVNFYQTTHRNIPEDSHLLSRRRENLISHSDLVQSGNSLTKKEQDRSMTEKKHGRMSQLLANSVNCC